MTPLIKDIELYAEKRALFYDGMMGDEYDLVRSILKEHPKLINAVIDVPMDKEDEEDEYFEMSGQTPLLSAVAFSTLEMVKLLVEEFDADINKGNYSNFTPIIKLAYRKDEKNEGMADYLLEKGVDVNQALDTGKTPLMLAAQNGSVEMVTKFLAHGADIHAKDREGSNVFYWVGYYDGKMKTAEDEKNIDTLVKLLLEHGADLYHMDKNGMTPLKMADKYQKPMVAKVFRKYIELHKESEL